MSTNRKKEHNIVGVIMVYIGAITILLFALLPYFLPLYFVPLPTIVSFIIVVFALFCFVYGFMCISLMKVRKKAQKVLQIEEKDETTR